MKDELLQKPCLQTARYVSEHRVQVDRRDLEPLHPTQKVFGPLNAERDGKVTKALGKTDENFQFDEPDPPLHFDLDIEALQIREFSGKQVFRSTRKGSHEGQMDGRLMLSINRKSKGISQTQFDPIQVHFRHQQRQIGQPRKLCAARVRPAPHVLQERRHNPT